MAGDYWSIMIRHACHFLEFQDSRPFQPFDLLLDHVLEGLVVDEARQFSSTVLSFILSHLPLNIPVDCNRDGFVKEKADIK